jgi:ankyrin repeat protein
MDQFSAAQHGDLQSLRETVTRDNVNNEHGDSTALHLAAHWGHTECTKYLLEMGANINARTIGGWVPLHDASEFGRVDVARVLLDAGADIEATGIDGWTPLYWSIIRKHRNVAQLLLDRGASVLNVLDKKIIPSFPSWILQMVASRSRCRSVSITMIGIHTYHRTNVTGPNDFNVLRLVSKHIWSSRMDDAWNTQVEPK